MRLPIQIVGSAVTSGYGSIAIVALCNDGTIWRKEPGEPWSELSPIPQPDKTDQPELTEDYSRFNGMWVKLTHSYSPNHPRCGILHLDDNGQTFHVGHQPYSILDTQIEDIRVDRETCPHSEWGAWISDFDPFGEDDDTPHQEHRECIFCGKRESKSVKA